MPTILLNLLWSLHLIIKPFVRILPHHVNRKNNNGRTESWKRILPQVCEERMASPCVLSVERHILCGFSIRGNICARSILGIGGKQCNRRQQGTSRVYYLLLSSGTYCLRWRGSLEAQLPEKDKCSLAEHGDGRTVSHAAIRIGRRRKSARRESQRQVRAEHRHQQDSDGGDCVED